MNNILMNQFKTNNINKTITTFYPGDTIEVKIWIIESAKRRLQTFEGVVIAIRRSHSCCFSFTVRKISHGEGVERIFQINSPAIDSIIVKRRSDVRKSKLYYLRNRVGKSARIKEKLN